MSRELNSVIDEGICEENRLFSGLSEFVNRNCGEEDIEG